MRPIEPSLVSALRALATSGLPRLSRPDLCDVRFGGRQRPDIKYVTLTDDAAIDFKTELAPYRVNEIDPEDWDVSVFTGVTAEHGTLVVEVGSVIRSDGFVTCDGITPDKESSHIYGWRWHVDEEADEARLWASRVRFASSRPPSHALVPGEEHALQVWRRYGARMVLPVGRRPDLSSSA
jgi:hypothetical protein